MGKKNYTYEVSFTFYCDDDIHEKVTGLPNVDVDDYYLDDDGDWCIDCTAYIQSAKGTMEAIDKRLHALVDKIPACWDYHYIKGIDTDFWWQP